MTLIGFKPRNHPQQVRVLGADDTIDTRVTPNKLWRIWHREFAFTLDAAANAKNAKCEKFYDIETNGLKQTWGVERVWCNPPFSDIPAWVRKALDETGGGPQGRCPLVVMLLPANRTEQRWWQNWIEPVRDRCESAVRTRFLPHRINFASEQFPDGKSKSSAPFGCVLVILKGAA